MRHKKTDPKVFVVVIPIEEGLTVWGPANPSLGMTLTMEYNLWRQYSNILRSVFFDNATINVVLLGNQHGKGTAVLERHGELSTMSLC